MSEFEGGFRFLFLDLLSFRLFSWVSKETNGKIKEIVQDVNPETKMVLASALYFKAQWEKTFLEGATGP